jgi:PAS domain S-box-containing protein
LDEENGSFRIRAGRGLSKQFIEQLSILPTEPDAVTIRALHAKEPIQVSDTETDPSYAIRKQRARAEGYRAILAVPLNTQHAPPTALLVFHPTPHVFTHNEIQLLTSFANHAAMAIENAMLYERSDMRLREQTHRLEALVQSLHDGLILGDLRGKVIYANKRVAELADLSTKSLPGMQVDQILARIIAKTSERSSQQNDVQKILNQKEERTVEISQSYPDGTTYLRLEVFNVNDVEGVPIGRGIFFHDITADRELDRMRSTLVSTVSHELRTPLAAIKGYASTMLADDVEWDRASQHEFLTIISDESDRLTNLVNNLLDLSRIEAGSLRLAREKCDTKEMINGAAKLARLTPGNKFEVHVEAKLPKLYADPPRLESILRNLIENAVKYGGENAKIRVEAGRQGNDFLFRVIDNGPGIPEKERQHIFESFYRVDDSLARLTSGAGLGLAICQGLVRAHGGRIWVEPREMGACIAFTIPAKTVAAPAGHKKAKKSVKQ